MSLPAFTPEKFQQVPTYTVQQYPVYSTLLTELRFTDTTACPQGKPAA
jgi:hypothetical protein